VNDDHHSDRQSNVSHEEYPQPNISREEYPQPNISREEYSQKQRLSYEDVVSREEYSQKQRLPYPYEFRNTYPSNTYFNQIAQNNCPPFTQQQKEEARKKNLELNQNKRIYF
jgi:hypothetical protein